MNNKVLVQGLREIIREKVNIFLTEKLGIIQELDEWVELIFLLITNSESNKIKVFGDDYPNLQKFLPLNNLVIDLESDISSQGSVTTNNWDGDTFDAEIKINKNVDYRNNLGKVKLILRHELTHLYERYKKFDKRISEFTKKQNALYRLVNRYLESNELKKYHDFLFLIYTTFDKEINANINEFYQLLIELEIDNVSDFKELVSVLELFQVRYKIENITIENLNKQYEEDEYFKMLIANFTTKLGFNSDEKTINYIVKHFKEKSKIIKEKVYRIISLLNLK